MEETQWHLHTRISLKEINKVFSTRILILGKREIETVTELIIIHSHIYSHWGKPKNHGVGGVNYRKTLQHIPSVTVKILNTANRNIWDREQLIQIFLSLPRVQTLLLILFK